MGRTHPRLALVAHRPAIPMPTRRMAADPGGRLAHLQVHRTAHRQDTPGLGHPACLRWLTGFRRLATLMRHRLAIHVGLGASVHHHRLGLDRLACGCPADHSQPLAQCLRKADRDQVKVDLYRARVGPCLLRVRQCLARAGHCPTSAFPCPVRLCPYLAKAGHHLAQAGLSPATVGRRPFQLDRCPDREDHCSVKAGLCPARVG
mmetsp:Transcript_25440/g.79128  ORF Transcript_25440/g.79128 Transcript_25440/m.79128 type:complete len:204 (-) Transcript_25440:467-1078(-)